MKNNSLILNGMIMFVSFALNSTNIDNLILPEGFKISVFADNINTPRQISETESGYVIVGSKKGDKIYALFDNDQDDFAEKKY